MSLSDRQIKLLIPIRSSTNGPVFLNLNLIKLWSSNSNKSFWFLTRFFLKESYTDLLDAIASPSKESLQPFPSFWSQREDSPLNLILYARQVLQNANLVCSTLLDEWAPQCVPHTIPIFKFN